MLLQNLIYQFFIAPSSASRRQSDPEKGTEDVNEEAASDPTSTADEDIGSAHGAQNARSHSSEGLTTDDDTDDNAIIRNLEREEYPNEEPSPRTPTRRRHFSSFATLSLKPKATHLSGISSWWGRLKAVLDPRTSHTDLESYVPHYRYLPIISGVIIPFSILLEVPGLTEDWYIRTEANKTVETKKNTAILDVALAFSITCAVLANVCLIVRFLEKKIKYMTVLCIIFLTIHDVINVIVVVIFGVEHRFDDGFTYGQAFWMTICSTSISLLTNVTLIVDLIRTPDFKNSGSGLTRKQRSLVICVIALMFYLGLGAFIQTILIDLTFLNALYFTVVSIETIGFGDIVPKSTGGRIFTCLYSVFGILNLALAVGLTRETVLEGLEIGYRKRVRAVRLRRKTVQWQRRVRKRWRAAIGWRLREAHKPVWVNDSSTARRSTVFIFNRLWPWTGVGRDSFHYNHTFGHGDYTHHRGMHLNLEALSWPQLEAAAMETGVPLHQLLPPGFKHPDGGRDGSVHHGNAPENHGPNSPYIHPVPRGLEDIPLTHARLGRMAVMLGNFAFAINRCSFSGVAHTAHMLSPASEEFENSPTIHRQPASEKYEAALAGMENEERRAFYARLFVIWTVFIVFWMVGSGIFMATEHWSYGTAMYFCFISFTTIGYGDYTPKTPAGRSVFIFWALLGVGTMTILISVISEAYSDRYKRVFHFGAFAQAVNNYRERTRIKSEKAKPAEAKTPFSPLARSTHSIPKNKPAPSSRSLNTALSDSLKRVEGQLEALPHKVLSHAKAFNNNIRYLIEPETLDLAKDSIPDDLKRLMNDVAGVEKLSERIKEEVLRDTDARHTLLAISIENALREMIEIAEDAIESLKERDMLNAQFQPGESLHPEGLRNASSEDRSLHQAQTIGDKPS